MDDLFDIFDEPAIDATLDFLIYDDVTREDDDEEFDLHELDGLEDELDALERDEFGLDLDADLDLDLEGLEDDFNEEFGADEDDDW